MTIFHAEKLRLGVFTMFAPRTSEHVPGLGLQPVPLFSKPMIFPLCGLPTLKTEVRLNWAFIQWMKLSLERLSHRALGQYLGTVYTTNEAFPVSSQPAAVWVFLARQGHSWSEVSSRLF